MSDDRYTQLERARQLLPIDETNPRYYTLLYVALRLSGCGVKESVKIINAEAKEKNIQVDYHHLYRELNTFMEVINESGERGFKLKMKLPAEEAIERLEERNTPPKNNLGHIIWIEAITRAPKTAMEFTRELRKVKSEIVNPTGG